MTKSDPFPVETTAETRRLRKRFQTAPVDPVEIELAKRDERERKAREKLAQRNYATPDPADLRGIPVTAHGVGGTAPGTDPYRAIDRLDNPSRRSPAD